MSLRTALLTALAPLVLAVVLVACGGGDDDGSGPSPAATNGTVAASTPAGGSGSGGATVTFAVGDGEAAVGQAATVELNALGIGTPGLGAWTIDVAYDNAVVSAACEVDTDAGMQFCNPVFEDSSIRLASANPNGTASGDVLLMTMTFTCEAAGTTDLTVSVDTLADATIGNPTDVNHAEDNGSITCT